MRRLSIFLMVTMLGVATMAGAQQDALDPVQQAMLEKVRAAVEQQNSWEQYRLFTVTTSRMAWTVTGDDTADWETRNITAQIDAQMEPEMGLVEGDLQWQSEIATSDETTPTS